MRFNDIMRRLDGISPKPLADVLKDPGKENLIHRESFSEIPPQVEYSLTEDRKQLCEAMLPLIQWAEKRDTIDNSHRKIPHGTYGASGSIRLPSQKSSIYLHIVQ
jgi:DNA-binding HxlR family transcriptional regulator